MTTMTTITIERVDHLALQLPANTSMASAILRAMAHGNTSDQADKDLDQALRERDEYHVAADDLAAQIAAITNQDIGEHSSTNHPWHNALQAADEFIAKELRTALGTVTLVPPAQGDVWPGQGGYYIGTMPAIQGAPGYHLVRAAQEAKDLRYGGSDHDTPGANSKHDGAANTAALLADSQPHPAAQWAHGIHAEGHADFYLPSQAELFLAWLCTPQLFQKSSYYWSSTQHSRHLAFVQDFEDGHSNWNDKDNEFRAVAVRRIPLL